MIIGLKNHDADYNCPLLLWLWFSSAALFIQNADTRLTGNMGTKKFFVSLLVFSTFLLHGMSGAGSDRVSVSVMERDSVTLHTDVKINQQEKIHWYFNDTRIAYINGDLSHICTDVQCEDPNERFRGRLKLDHQTGSLTITDTRTTDSEEYKLLIISSSSDSEKIFNVTVIERFGPTIVNVSDSSSDRLHVSWSPVQPEQVQQYRVQYGEIPRGLVWNLTLPSNRSSAFLTQLRPDTEYLITITALHSSGQQRAMSIRACTPEALPALTDLQLTAVGRGLVQVEWQGQGAGLLGYWVSWKNEDQPLSSSSSSSMYLPPNSLSTELTELGPGSRVCVSPVYRSAYGEGLCCTTRT